MFTLKMANCNENLCIWDSAHIVTSTCLQRKNFTVTDLTNPVKLHEPHLTLSTRTKTVRPAQ